MANHSKTNDQAEKGGDPIPRADGEESKAVNQLRDRVDALERRLAAIEELCKGFRR